MWCEVGKEIGWTLRWIKEVQEEEEEGEEGEEEEEEVEGEEEEIRLSIIWICTYMCATVMTLVRRNYQNSWFRAPR